MPDGDRAMKPAKALFAYSLLYLFAHLRRLSGRRGRPARAGAAGSCMMEIEEELVTLTGKPEEGAAQPLGRDRAGAGGARRHLLRRHDRQVRPRAFSTGRCERPMTGEPRPLRQRRSAPTASSPASASPSSAAWSAWPMPRCRSTSMFCQVTGYGGTTQRVEQYSDRVLDRTITVRFDANMSGGMPWEFEPVAARHDHEDRRDGRRRITRATNLFDTPTVRPRHLQRARRRWPAPISTRSNASASPTRR